MANAPPGSINPNLVIDAVRTNANVFRATDRLNPAHFIEGRLSLGVLTFAILARTAGVNRGVSGQEFFAAMMKHFGEANVNVIQAHWFAGIGMDSNIDRFNANLVAGIEEAEAAKQTWTGERAMDYQFANATVHLRDPYAGPPGQYIEVVVYFTR